MAAGGRRNPPYPQGFGGRDEIAENPEAWILADRMAALGTLVAGVAHEINNPITYVLANLAELGELARAMREGLGAYRGLVDERLGEAAAERLASAEDKIRAAGGVELIDELIGDAEEGAERIRELVRDLLRLSHPGREQGRVDVHEILDSALRLVGRKLAVAARLERDYGELPEVRGDRARLGQVFLNLIANAADACDPPDPDSHVVGGPPRAEGERAVIEIRDDGVGIPREHRGRIFSPFFTTKAPGAGTGLGLYLSRLIVEQHGGSLELAEENGAERGAAFVVSLPVRRG